MMNYFPLTDTARKEMLDFIGARDIKELFADIPPKKSYFPLDDIPAALSEDRLIHTFNQLAARNRYRDYLSFLGGGAYNHFIPEVVNHLSGKGELLTPYTPYQPEVSQGSLQAMFEYQTMMAMLTGLDIANSSLYDGGTAAAEGALLTVRKSKKNRILMAANLHPEYIEIVNTYIQNLDIEADLVDYDRQTGKLLLDDLEAKLDDHTAAFIFQSPNFLGVVEEAREISALAHNRQAYSAQAVTEAMSLPFLTPAAENGVDVIVGEAQSFGLPLGFGGPYLGFIAARQEFLRQMPGRLVGQTTDGKGRRGYVLTLSTREQHIKREKATSNICTNQAWCALRAAIYMSTMGKQGLMEIARTNHLNTAYFVKEAAGLKSAAVKYTKDFFNEVVLEVQDGSVADFQKRLQGKKILAGIPLKWFYPDFENAVLLNFTEIHRKEDIDRLIQAIGETQ
jgi:glycine dehydrogenase subunit 1